MAERTVTVTFPSRHSINCAIVIRLGIACGFTIMSGTIPSNDQGMSSWRYVIPIVPFCPCREANLSPIWGTRTFLMRTCTDGDGTHGDPEGGRRGMIDQGRLQLSTAAPVVTRRTNTSGCKPNYRHIELREHKTTPPICYRIILLSRPHPRAYSHLPSDEHLGPRKSPTNTIVKKKSLKVNAWPFLRILVWRQIPRTKPQHVYVLLCLLKPDP